MLFRLPPGYGYQYDGYQGYQNQDQNQGLGGYMDQQGRQQQGEYRSGNQVLDCIILSCTNKYMSGNQVFDCTVMYWEV